MINCWFWVFPRRQMYKRRWALPSHVVDSNSSWGGCSICVTRLIGTAIGRFWKAGMCWSTSSTSRPSEKISHSAPSDALPRPRAIELSGLPRRNLPSLGSSLGSLGSLGTLGPSKESGAPRIETVQPVQPIQAVQAVPELKEEVEPFQFQPIQSIQPVRQAGFPKAVVRSSMVIVRVFSILRI
jgi:hypothetical protein